MKINVPFRPGQQVWRVALVDSALGADGYQVEGPVTVERLFMGWYGSCAPKWTVTVTGGWAFPAGEFYATRRDAEKHRAARAKQVREAAAHLRSETYD